LGTVFAQQQTLTVLSKVNKVPLSHVLVYKENQLVATTDNDGLFHLDPTNLGGFTFLKQLVFRI
jgi:hypothetical protein